MNENEPKNVWASLLDAADSLAALFFVGLLISMAVWNWLAIGICVLGAAIAFGSTFWFRKQQDEDEDRARDRARYWERKREREIIATREQMESQFFVITDERILALRNDGVAEDVIHALTRIMQRFGKDDGAAMPGPLLLQHLDRFAGRGRVDPFIDKLQLFLLLFEPKGKTA